MHGIAALLEVTELEIFGGAARDVLADPAQPVSDIDVAVRGGTNAARACHTMLSLSSSCGTPTPVRPYWVHLIRPVATFDVPWNGTILDVSFMDHTPQAHFDAETVIWRFPELTYRDPYKVTSGPVTRVRLVSRLDAENPVLLLNRILKLAAKYHLDMAADPNLRMLVGELADRARSWKPDDDFHGQYAHQAHFRHFHAAIRRAHDPESFIRSCLLAGLLDARLGRLADILRASPRMARLLADQAPQCDLTAFWAVVDTLVGTGPGWREYQPRSVPSAARDDGSGP